MVHRQLPSGFEATLRVSFGGDDPLRFIALLRSPQYPGNELEEGVDHRSGYVEQGLKVEHQSDFLSSGFMVTLVSRFLP